MSPPEALDKQVKRHDALLRLFAADPEAATALVLAPLPDAARRRLPERLFEPVPTEHIDGDAGDALRRVSIDRLLILRLPDGRDLIVILEGKSSSASRTLSQFGDYHRAVLRWYRKHYRKHRGNGDQRDPVILSMVAYNGEREWTVPFGVSEPEEVAWLLGHLLDGGVPIGNYVLLDLVRGDRDWQAQLSFEARMMLAALAWQPADGEEAVRELIRAIPEGDDLEWQLGGYFAGERGMDAGFMDRTWYDLRPHLRRHPKMRALRDEWKAEGQQAMLQKQLEGFYGPLPADARRRIAEASPEQLRSWARAVPVAVRDGKGVDFVLNGALH